MSAVKNEPNSQRETGYSALIPFYILYDLDLNAHHLRLYGQIQQMESNPNPKVQPTFSYEWMANQLGINRRNTMNCAKLLKEKKYIERIKIEGKWLWQTVKKGVLIEDDTDSATLASVAQRHHGVSPSDTQRYKSKGINTSSSNSPSKPTNSTPTPVELASIFEGMFPSNPEAPRGKNSSFDPGVMKRIKAFKKFWLEEEESPLSAADFVCYLELMKSSYPGFCNNEYAWIEGGKERKNGFMQFINPVNASKAFRGILM